MPFDFYTQYSTFPLFHHSMWMAPLLRQIALMDNGILEKIEETPVSKILDKDFLNRIGFVCV
jgi:hypothetical protein